MYCEFYQLSEPPFNVTPDPKFLYLNARYREAIASLNYGITQRKGFITLIGEAGTGKTTLLNKLLEELPQNTKSVFIFNTNVTFEEILEYVFAEFALPVHNGKKLYMLQRLNAFLLEELRGGVNVALLIDEAQDLEFSVLEDLRLLSNLETAKEKILQIVLSGQPELGQKLSNPILRQLRQRIGINCRLLPLSRDEITEYIQYRLQAAGCPDLKLFSREAEEQIYRFSRGIPRLVNVVCDNALVIGYALGRKRIGAEVITEAAADLLSVEPAAEELVDRPAEVSAPVAPAAPRSSWRARLAVATVVVLAMVIGLLSVGRTLLPRHGEEHVASAPEAQPLEVIRPGSEQHGSGVDAAPPRAAANPANLPIEPRERAMPEPVPPVRAAAAEAVAEPPARLQAEKPPSDEHRPAAADEGPRPLERRKTKLLVEEGLLVGASEPPAPPRMQAAELKVPETDKPSRVAKADQPRADAAAVEASRHPAEHGEPMLPPEPKAERGGKADSAPPVEEAGALRLDGVQFARVVVRSGESISGIAQRKYGQASYTILDLLKLANPELTDIDVVSAGQTIRLPELSDGFPILDDGSGKYALLVFSSPQMQRAAGLQNALRGRGFDARLAAGSIGSQKPLYRVVLPGFADRGEVIEVGHRLQKLFREDTKIAQLGE